MRSANSGFWLFIVTIVFVAGVQGQPTTQEGYPIPVFANISVHDPSVIKVDDTYYIFGSHLSAAKTTDWMAWERVADLVTAENPLFDDVTEALSETFEWAQSDTLWAADVRQLADGRYYFYYNACKGDSPRSAMGLAVADTIEGPYQNVGIFLRSGMWGMISEDGENIYDATIHPNVVDPHVFYDKDGKLWMVYGSYSGGIFILEMDETTGLPFEGQGYGKRLMGGNHQRIEGPFILYSPHTKFYYLFVSFGGLAFDGGYNIRVARSETPDGPYYDSEGNNMRDVHSDIAFDDATVFQYGVKLMGNHYVLGTPFPYMGYVSPGHNSACYDNETGQYFLIFHARFLVSGDYHEVRVHEMTFNEQGWPVVSPLRYAPRVAPEPTEEPVEQDTLIPEPDPELLPDEGIVDPVQYPENPEIPEESDGENSEPEEIPPPPLYQDDIAIEEIPGSFQILIQPKEVVRLIVYSKETYLDEDGTVSGAYQGTWQFAVETNGIIVDLREDGLYSGIVSRQWNEQLQAFTVVFSALNEAGNPAWGMRWSDLLLQN